MKKHLIFKQIVWIVLCLPFCIQGITAQTAQREQSVTVHLANASLQEVFSAIEKQTTYRFSYRDVVVDNRKDITVERDNAPVGAVLNDVLRGRNLEFNIVSDRSIVIFDRRPANNRPPAQRPVKRIIGEVVDNAGEPVVGATVLEKGTASNGTITDLDGKFTLTVQNNATLQISYVGFAPQDIVVGDQTSISIMLTEDTQALDEVVVVGYGTQRKETLSGAISKVSSDIMVSRPITNAAAALQGEIPGMVVQRSSGQPGNENFDLNVRGASSTNGGNSPLVLIDGIAGDINLINIQDIESISILKDASASIYGARAAGGVVLVTTKRGSTGAPRVSYSGNMAVSKMTGMMESPTNYEMAIMDNEANIHNGSTPMYTQDMLNRILNNDPNPIDHPLYGGWKLFFTNTDWAKEFLNNGFQHKHSVIVSGGGERANYFLSAGYSKQYGVIRYANDNNERYNLRLNYDYGLTDYLKLETKISLENQKRTDLGGVGSWIITEATFGMPNHPVYNNDGNFFAQGGWGNAVGMAKDGETATYNTKGLNGNFKFVATLSADLTLNAQVGINYQNLNNTDIAKAVPLYTWDNEIAYYGIAGSPAESAVNRESGEVFYQNYTGYMQYDKTLAGKHHLNVMLGVSYEKEEESMFSARRDNFLTETLWSLNLGGTGNMSNDAEGQHWAIASAFSRIGYNYKNKYILETNIRYDGSSRFNRNSRWGVFPGVSLGWRLSQENFMKNLDMVDELKLRASYGQTGNQDGIRLYDYIQLLKMRGPYPFGNGTQAQSVYLDVLAGVDRTWEILENTNVGIDAAFLSSRLSLSFDYFIKMNNNMLIPITYPSMLGATPPESNSGKLRTSGFEFVLGWKDKIKDWEYAVRLQLSDAKNKLIEYGGADTYTLGLNEVREGYPINSYFAYVYDGVIKTQAELDEYKKLRGVPTNIDIGDARFKDINNDGQISTYGDTKGDDGDAVYVGSITPRYSFGINLNAKYKQVDLGVFFQGIGKRTLFREGEYAMPWSDWWRQPARFYYGITWNEDRTDAEYPRLSHGEIRYWNYQESTLQQINAAYIRLKNIQLGYTLPQLLLQKIGISHARMYVSGQDLFELHNIKGGWDPESERAGFNYPFQRYYSFGIDLTF
jgi:TonB-linked SusC/RagA family outer membrane protein